MNTRNLTDQIRADLAYQKERILFEQFNSLIKDGVLMIEETEPVLVKADNEPGVKLQQAVRLTFNGEKVLEKYRILVEELSQKLETIKSIINETAQENNDE